MENDDALETAQSQGSLDETCFPHMSSTSVLKKSQETMMENEDLDKTYEMSSRFLKMSSVMSDR